MTVENTGPSLRIVTLVAVAGLVLGAGLLWGRYGGAVFAEMIASAWAFCF